MSSRLSVIFYIILCLEIGIFLTVLPWVPQGWMGLSDWGNNYFLLLAARKIGFYGLQSFVASGWVRGAVSGLGVLNLGMAFWEIVHFRQTVRVLDAESRQQVARKQDRNSSSTDAARSEKTDPLSDYRRENDR
jgi:hypothetical protein